MFFFVTIENLCILKTLPPVLINSWNCFNLITLILKSSKNQIAMMYVIVLQTNIKDCFFCFFFLHFFRVRICLIETRCSLRLMLREVFIVEKVLMILLSSKICYRTIPSCLHILTHCSLINFTFPSVALPVSTSDFLPITVSNSNPPISLIYNLSPTARSLNFIRILFSKFHVLISFYSEAHSYTETFFLNFTFRGSKFTQIRFSLHSYLFFSLPPTICKTFGAGTLIHFL